MKRLKAIYSRNARIVCAVLLILMLVGSFFDLPISRFLYPGHESSIGQFFAAFGEMPCHLLICCAGTLLFFIRSKLREDWNVLFILGSAALFLMGIAIGVYEAKDNVAALPTWVAVLVMTFFAVLSSFGVLVLSRGCSVRTVLRFIITVVFVTVGTMAVVNLVKMPWARPRMRLITVTGNESYFMQWWKIGGGGLKEKLVAEGVPVSEFRSFPSGHSACAACAMLAILLPTLSRRWRGSERTCMLVGAGWTFVVALSRICMGAHFLTDVTAAALITLVIAVVGVRLVYFNQKVFNWIWHLVAKKDDKEE